MGYPFISLLNIIHKKKMTLIAPINPLTGEPYGGWIQNRTDDIKLEKTDVEIKFVQTHPDAILPIKNYQDPLTGDAGFDLFAVETTTIPARGSAVVPVGLKLGYITPGYYFRIEARSGLGFNKSLEPHPGIIDNPYRGDLGIKLFNLSDQDQTIEKGKGTAQFIVYKMYNTQTSWISAEDVEQSVRNENGFGSSDNK